MAAKILAMFCLIISHGSGKLVVALPAKGAPESRRNELTKQDLFQPVDASGLCGGGLPS